MTYRWLSTLCILALVLIGPGLLAVPLAGAAPVPTSAPTLHISQMQAGPGDTIYLTSTGFTAGETVTISGDVCVDGTP